MNKKEAYNNAYNKQNYTGVSFRLNTQTEADVINALKAQENLKAYLVKLIRADQRRTDKKRGRVMNRGDRNLHADYQRYPLEVIEEVGRNDRYTVGFADCLENAQAMAAEYASRPNVGPIRIYYREYDKDMNCMRALEVD